MYAVVLVDSVSFDAKEFAKKLIAQGLQTRPFFRGMHNQPLYRRMRLFQDVVLQVTERLYLALRIIHYR